MLRRAERCLQFAAHACAVSLTITAAACADPPADPTRAAPVAAPAATLVPGADGLACTESGATLSSGALFIVCVRPDNWNRDLVVFIPGYRDPASALDLPDDFGDAELSPVITQLGYAFATTSFRGTGLIEPETWIGDDLVELVHTARAALTSALGRNVRFTYQTGGSQGGLGTVLAVERHPQLFSGGLAACGPIGDYRRQIEYIADFRVAFDYFFADVIPGWPVWSQSANDLATDPAFWPTAERMLAAALAEPSNAPRVQQLLAVTRAPVSAGNPQTIAETVGGLLWYSFRGTRDATAKLGGLPFDNSKRVYAGSLDDDALNAGVERFRLVADPARVALLQTSGRLVRPLVTMHTTGDPIVPFWHQSVYRRKLTFIGRILHSSATFSRYGHCSFSATEILAGFAVLVLKVSGTNLVFSVNTMAPAQRTEFLRLARQLGANPVERH